MNISQPVASAIVGVDFGILSADEIRALSVKRIINPVTFDNLLHPTRGGLYDTALGAFMDQPCSTCHLNSHVCPGHCGHIELPVHVFHCQYIDQMFRLFRAQCRYCHRLRISRVEANRLACKLRLIRCGLLKEAEDLEDVTDTSADDAVSEDSSNEEDAEAGGLISRRLAFTKSCIQKAGLAGRKGTRALDLSEAATEARRSVILAFQASLVKSRKCNNCKAFNPAYRKNGAVSVFRKPLSNKDRAGNAQLGLKVEESPLEMLNRIQQKQEQKRRRQAERRRAQLEGDAQHEDEGVADMDSSSHDEDGDVRILEAPLEDSAPVSEEEGEDLANEDAEGSALLDQAAMPKPRSKQKDKDKEADGETFINCNEVHASLVHLFDRERELLTEVYGTGIGENPVPPSADMFFIQQLLVPPSKYRKEQKTGPDEISEAADNAAYRKILSTCQDLFQIRRELQGADPETSRKRTYDDLNRTWLQLQESVNAMVDSDKAPTGRFAALTPRGVKQKLEKKEGLMRMNVMGKRVNFAARSVISPDPNIETNEVGIPPVFAKKLTYPEPVTAHSFEELKQAVLNGPEVWPGAAAVENENGQVINLRNKTAIDRQAIANTLMAPSSSTVTGARNKKVHRHLTNGDIVIMNRQPTLHKPSMMAHRARVLPGEKTIRMHYANCNSYNADFDGDEMNMHFPQNEIARAEAVQIADTDHQYLSATAGEPLRGLIQDHISIAVWLSCLDTFFTREEYQELLYSCLRPENNHTNSDRIKTVPPTILKPVKRWTGKQIITTILLNLQPESFAPIHMASKSQIPKDRWGKGSEEEVVRIDKGEMLTGVLDKKQIGPKSGGLVHIVYEAYGHTAAGKFISILGRLLTKLLNMNAFSCGVEDLVMTEAGEKTRKDMLDAAERMGLDVAARYVSLQDENPTLEDKEFRERLEMVTRDDEKLSGLDTMVGNATKVVTSDLSMACLPAGLSKPFPRNQMQAMTVSGAKGSSVNANLISCALGQQNLEGRRVPIMISGKTLPAFKPFEPSFRAGGYIVDRFLTGVRPQEYYFHLMAGREGLVDTAVKTSRSGYLQRCLVKGLEGLRAGYDASVRDADGTLIQTLYGEDGLDTTKQAKLFDFNFVATNFHSLLASLNVVNDAPRTTLTEEAANAREYNKKAEKTFRKTGNVSVMDPALALFPPSSIAGSTSEKYIRAAKQYLTDNPDKLIRDSKNGIEGEMTKRAMESVMDFNYLKSVIQAGEAVGVVASQSVGEPSTQMTLNTFHLAGHSAKNVTLGIPRLREILMTASMNIKTPTMDLHFIPEMTMDDREKFARGISRRSLAEVVDEVSVVERTGGSIFKDGRVYDIIISLFPSKEYTETYAITVDDVAWTLQSKLIPIIDRTIRAELKKRGQEKSLQKVPKSDAQPEVGQSAGRTQDLVATNADADNEGGDSDRDDDGDDDATTAKKRANIDEGMTYEDPDESDEEIERAGEREASAEPEAEPEDETYGSGESRAGTPDRDDRTKTVSAPNTPSKKQQQSKKNDVRLNQIRDKYAQVSAFSFNDDSKADHCSLTFEYPAATAKLVLLPLVKKALHAALIQEIPGISAALLNKPEAKDKWDAYVTTSGANLRAMRLPEHQAIINPHRLYTNSVGTMLSLYGVEAARATIIRELASVFAGHGIAVDPRHLTLVADYMTRSGGYLPFSRNGFRGKSGAFAKMSFETTMGFLRDAVLEGARENLDGPSARITVGRIGQQGTGGFDVLLPVAGAQA